LYIENEADKRHVYPRIRQLSVKKKRGASSVSTKFFKNGTTPMTIAKACAYFKIKSRCRMHK